MPQELEEEMRIERNENWIRNVLSMNTHSTLNLSEAQSEVDSMTKVVNLVSSKVQHGNGK